MRKANILFISFNFSLLTFLFTLPAFSQQRWARTYGGTGDDYGYSVQQTSDGGYIVVGYTNSFGNSNQVYLIKTNASGNTLWTRTYGGGAWDFGYSVQQTSDGGYIVAGTTESFGNGLYDVYLIKTNASGGALWTRAYGGAEREEGYSVQQTTDGGYIVAGYTLSFGNGYQVYLVKTNASGDTLWIRTYGGAGEDYGYFVQQTSEGGYIVVGYTNSFGNGNNDVYLIKTNASGDTLWTRTYGNTGYEWGYSVQQTSDGGYIVAGVKWPGYNSQVYLVKTNASGDTLWSRLYGGAGSEWSYSVQQTTDGGYIVAGWTNSFGDSDQVYLVKTNSSGDTLWTRTYGGTGKDLGASVQQTTDGGYIVAGATSSFGNGYQVYLIKTDPNGSSGVEDSPGHGSRVTSCRVSPNPFTSFTTLPGHEVDRFALYDISGRRVGTYRGDRIGEGLGPGVYFVKLDGGNGKPARIVKMR